jgi:hypothetical protein
MQDNNKRKSKLVGMNNNKKDAIKRLKEARSGVRRLDQAIQVNFKFLLNY